MIKKFRIVKNFVQSKILIICNTLPNRIYIFGLVMTCSILSVTLPVSSDFFYTFLAQIGDYEGHTYIIGHYNPSVRITA